MNEQLISSRSTYEYIRVMYGLSTGQVRVMYGYATDLTTPSPGDDQAMMGHFLPQCFTMNTVDEQEKVQVKPNSLQFAPS